MLMPIERPCAHFEIEGRRVFRKRRLPCAERYRRQRRNACFYGGEFFLVGMRNSLDKGIKGEIKMQKAEDIRIRDRSFLWKTENIICWALRETIAGIKGAILRSILRRILFASSASGVWSGRTLLQITRRYGRLNYINIAENTTLSFRFFRSRKAAEA